MKINYLLFLSVRNLTAIVRLDNAETINISNSSQDMLLWAKQPSPPHPAPPQKIFCQEIHGLPFYRLSQFGIWTVFAFPFQTAFQYARLLKRRQAAT